MAGTDPNALSQIWQDPGTALQILGTLAPNVVYRGYPIHIREGMQQLGTQIGNVQQRAYLEQAMDKARGQLYPTSSIPGVDQAAEDIEGAVAGGVLPQRPGAEQPNLFSRARGLELARPMPLGQFLGTLTPQQRRAMMAGSTAPRAGEGPIASGMDIYGTQRQEALGELDATKARLWRQAGDIALKGDPTSDDPHIQDAWGALNHLALRDPESGLQYLKDERSRVTAEQSLSALGMDPK